MNADKYQALEIWKERALIDKNNLSTKQSQAEEVRVGRRPTEKSLRRERERGDRVDP